MYIGSTINSNRASLPKKKLNSVITFSASHQKSKTKQVKKNKKMAPYSTVQRIPNLQKAWDPKFEKLLFISVLRPPWLTAQAWPCVDCINIVLTNHFGISSPHLLQVFGRVLQSCFAVRLAQHSLSMGMPTWWQSFHFWVNLPFNNIFVKKKCSCGLSKKCQFPSERKQPTSRWPSVVPYITSKDASVVALRCLPVVQIRLDQTHTHTHTLWQTHTHI